MEKQTVAIKDKWMLNLDEASEYFGIGKDKLRSLTDEPECPFVLWNASKRLIKRTMLEQYLLGEFSI